MTSRHARRAPRNRHPGSRAGWPRRWPACRAWPLFAVVVGVGCGDIPPAAPNPDAGPSSCPAGHVLGPADSCMPVGIQDCAAIFVQVDGLCRPSIDTCPAGTIPNFKEGCVPTGIPGCASIFIEADGLCHPSIDKCPAGMIPKIEQGCVAAGIPDCAPEFMEPDGLCHPSMAKCPAGTFAAPQKGCIPIDGAGGCGTGTWGNVADAPDTIYVDPTYPGMDSDGSKTKPVHTIAEAMPLVPASGRVVLAAGTYSEGVQVPKPVTLEGRCPSMVRIEGTVDTPSSPAAIWIDAVPSVTLRRLGIGGLGMGIRAYQASGLTIEQVLVQSASINGIVILGPADNILLSESLIEGTLPKAGVGLYGHGVHLSDGVHAVVRDNAIVANHVGGVTVSGLGTDVTAVGNLIEGTLPEQSSQFYGRGLRVSDGGHLSLIGNAVVDNHETGLLVIDPDTDLVATGNLIERTLPAAADGLFGQGIVLGTGTRATLDQNAVLDNRYCGIQAVGADVTATGNLVEGTRERQGDQAPAVGIVMTSGTVGTLSDNTLIENHGAGIALMLSGTVVTVSSNLIERTLSDPSGVFGHGIQVSDGAHADLYQNALIRNHYTALYVADNGTHVTFANNLAEGTLPSAIPGGFGALVGVGARATLAGNAFLDNQAVSVALQDTGTDASVSGNLIKGTLPEKNTLEFGFAVQAVQGVRASFFDNALVENYDAGIWIDDPGTDVTAARNLIERTFARKSDQNPALGFLVVRGATATLTENAVLQTEGGGIEAEGSGTTATMTANLIADTLSLATSKASGLGIQVSDGALATIEANVLLRNQYIALLVTMPGTHAAASGNLIEGTLPRQDDGEYGGGVSVHAGAALSLGTSVLRNNHGFAIFAASPSFNDTVKTTADIAQTLIDGVATSSFTLLNPTVTYTDLGDGILVVRGAIVDVKDTLVQRCSRAGVLFDSSPGNLSTVSSTENPFGLVLQGTLWPAYQDGGNVFAGNAKQDIVMGGNLPVPNTPAPIPPPPPL